MGFEIDADLTRRLKELARRERATLFMTLLAAFQVLLHRYSGQEDVAVGVPVAGRSAPEVEPLIGFFVNMLVMRGDLSGQPGFDALLGRVRQQALDAYEHQELPFERIVMELAPARATTRNPLFQVSFALHNAGQVTFRLPGLAVEEIDDPGLYWPCGYGEYPGILERYVRDEPFLRLEEAIRKMTSETAALFGIAGRGVLAPGAFADVNVIDFDNLSLPAPEYVYDLPGGAGRLYGEGLGIEHVFVNGVEVVAHGALTGAQPGGVLRSGRDTHTVRVG